MVLGYLFLFFVFAGVVGVIYWSQYASTENPQSSLKQTPEPVDETANWKTYRNEQHGISFKYPPTYFLTTQTGESFESPYIKSLNQSVSWADSQWLRVGILPGVSTSQDEALAILESEPSIDWRANNESHSERTIVINGRKIKLVIFAEPNVDNEFSVHGILYDSNMNYIFLGLDAIGNTMEDAQLNPVIDNFIQILSTLKLPND